MHYPIRVGISVPPNDLGPARAAEIESRGFDLVVLADHVFHYRSPELPFLDAWMRLAAMTQATNRIRLGTLVTNLSWRQPVVVAKNAIAVDQLSGGRLELGVGCGGYADQTMMGMADMPPGERVSRLDEGLDVLSRLLSGDTRPFAGQFTSYAEAHVAPGCIQLPRPPLVVAASGRRALSVAARWADTWNCVCGDDDLEATERILTAKANVLNDSCGGVGRDPQTLRRSLLLWRTGGTNPWSHPSALLEIVERFSPLGFSDFIAFHPPAERYDIFDHVTTAALPELRNETTTIE